MKVLRSRLADRFPLLVCLFSSAWPSHAQNSEAHILPVAVVTAAGKPVTNLQAQNLRVQDRGVQVNGFSLNASPRRIALLIDIGSRMGKSNGRVSLSQAAVHTAGLLLDRLSSVDLISVYVFAEKAREVVPWTRDFRAVRSALMDLPKPGTDESKREYGVRTDLDGALNSALAALSEHPQFGDAIVIFSDGIFPRVGAGDILNYYDQPDYLVRATPQLGTLGVRVFFSLAGNVAGTPPLHGIEVFMGATGGESFELDDSGSSFHDLNTYDRPKPPIYRSDSLEQRALALSAAIQNTYRLQLEFVKPLEKPMRLHLELVDEQGKALHNVAVLSPSFVYPGTKAQP